MNTQYFTEFINALNKLSPYLTKYQAYVSKTLADESMSCEQLAVLAAQAALKLAESSAWVAALSAKATSECATMQSNITTALAKLAPLLLAPTDLPSVITWINSMIETFAGPNAALLAQEITIAEQLVQIADAVASTTIAVDTLATSIITAIQQAQIKQGCTI